MMMFYVSAFEVRDLLFCVQLRTQLAVAVVAFAMVTISIVMSMNHTTAYLLTLLGPGT